MYLNVVPSSSCSLHQIRMPERLRKIFAIDLGDWLVFDTTIGPYSVQIQSAILEDLMEHGDSKAFVSPHSPILESNSSEVIINPHDLTIGCDPELFLLYATNGRVFEAYKLLAKESQFGSDGDLAELRPDYALCPEQLMVNMKHLISYIPQVLPGGIIPHAASWHAYRCCGFHVHLGLPIELLSFAADKTDAFIKNMVSALDYFVGIPSAALDPENRRRFNREYGKPGDYRLSMRTLEYRTPGGFHLRSPAYTYSLLATSFKVAETIIRDAEEASGGWVDMNEVVSYEYFKNRYNLPNKSTIKEIMLSKGRGKLEEETEKIRGELTPILGEYAASIVRNRHPDERNLLDEWLGDAT